MKLYQMMNDCFLMFVEYLIILYIMKSMQSFLETNIE